MWLLHAAAALHQLLLQGSQGQQQVTLGLLQLRHCVIRGVAV
jgi:hypothetical protein